MCGIAGIIYNQTQAVGSKFLEVLFNSFQHRGPDGKGWFAYHAENEAQGSESTSLSSVKALLLHQRLAIIDLTAAGHQPLLSSCGRYVITYNGEIYNYLELKRELEDLGYQFKTKTDTEVLLTVYLHWGIEGLKKCEGMFAFAILDKQEKKLVLVRDFFGIKPLYYSVVNGNFIFASEIKTLLNVPEIKRKANPQRVYDYLRFGLTDHGQETLFAGIYQLESAHYLEVFLENPSVIFPKRFWSITPKDNTHLTFQQAAEQLKTLFFDSVAKHLRSDVPIGSALSGGIDSSSIVMTMRHLHPSASLHAFSYIADDMAISEEKWIDKVAKAAKVNLHKIHANTNQLLQDLDDLIFIQDEPFGSTSIYAQYCIFRQVKNAGVKVMLDGQGADEILGGYYPYLSALAVSLLRQRRLLELLKFSKATQSLPGITIKQLTFGALNCMLGPKLQTITRRWINKDLDPMWLNMPWFAEYKVVPPMLRHNKARYVLRTELFKSVTEHGLPQLLRYEDRNSMASSIESRVPFLIPSVVNFLFGLPEKHIINLQATTKAVFRTAMQDTVPAEILNRKDKIGFQTPEKRWLEEMKIFVDTVMFNNDQLINKTLPINLKMAKVEWEQTSIGKKQFDSRFWRWVNLIRWSDLYGVVFE